MTHSNIRTGMFFTANYEGERWVFQAVEHFNIGKGYVCARFDAGGGRQKGLVGCSKLTDLKTIGETRAPNNILQLMTK